MTTATPSRPRARTTPRTEPPGPDWATRRIVPVTIGPTWQVGDDGRYVLPRYTLGWHGVAWAGRWLQATKGGPWRFTGEQFRWLLWWYAVELDDLCAWRFVYRDGVLQRLKGWGKDPLAAVLCAIELMGPCRPSGEIAEEGNEWGVPAGQPLGQQHPSPWVTLAAVSKEQTRNTMRIFPGLFPARTRAEFGLQLGKTLIYADHARCTLEAATSAPETLEGARSSFTLRNETHHWREANSGHEMAAVIERNATKSADGSARALSITNAYDPSQDSVAQRQREAYESMAGNSHIDTGVLYDSLEAPEDAPLTADVAPRVLQVVRGDAVWLNIPRLVASILDPQNPPSRSRRFWYNQVGAAEDAWVDPLKLRMRSAKHPDADVDPVEDGDEVVLFFDGSKSDDATGLAACRMSDGHVITVEMWGKPPGPRGAEWVVPRSEVDAVVEQTIEERFRVVGFWADPSHTRDDEHETRYWDALIDDWHARWKDQFEIWAQPGKGGHSVMWDMATPQHTREFTDAAMRTATEIDKTGTFTFDGDPRMFAHLRNARRFPNAYGVSLWKGHRESKNKVDLAVCAVGARMVRRNLMLAGRKRKRSGRVV